ncbi:MAG TPA: hypothetical protein VGU71_13390 [Candidatus Dormibacteraeota bacterium]|nr:hypothetical protein [Candidatus Dormibacteraeota bacterium]
MKRFLCVAFAAMAIAACGGGTPTVSGPAGTTGSGAGKASIDLTVSGGVEGKSTQLSKYDCAGGAFGSYLASLSPVINGQQYKIDVLITKYKGAPATYNLPADNVGLTFGTDKKEWSSNVGNTTGRVTINAGGDSGAVDAHFAPSPIFGFEPIDLQFTFVCPAKK